MATPKKLSSSTPVYIVWLDNSLTGQKVIGIYLNASAAFELVDRYPGSRILRTSWACIQAARKANFI